MIWDCEPTPWDYNHSQQSKEKKSLVVETSPLDGELQSQKYRLLEIKVSQFRAVFYFFYQRFLLLLLLFL